MDIGLDARTELFAPTMSEDEAIRRIPHTWSYAAMNKLVAIAVLSTMLGLGQVANAQVAYQTYAPVVGGFDQLTNTVTYRPAYTAYSPAVTFAPAAPVGGSCCGAAPAATYAAPPVTTYSPVTAYSPVTTYSPVTAYSPVTPVAAYSPVVAYSPVAPVTSYLPMTTYSPVVSYSPVVAAPVAYPAYYRPAYVPGEPVRNVFRAFWY